MRTGEGKIAFWAGGSRYPRPQDVMLISHRLGHLHENTFNAGKERIARGISGGRNRVLGGTYLLRGRPYHGFISCIRLVAANGFKNARVLFDGKRSLPPCG
jgi:hypothetical protein